MKVAEFALNWFGTDRQAERIIIEGPRVCGSTILKTWIACALITNHIAASMSLTFFCCFFMTMNTIEKSKNSHKLNPTCRKFVRDSKTNV